MRTFSPGWSYQPGLKVPFSPGSTLHPGQNGSRGHLSSYFTTAPHPLSLILITFSSSTFFLQQSFLSFPLIPSSPSLRSLPHLPPSPAQAESGEPPLPAGPASFGCGAASCGPTPAGTGGPASHRRHARPGAGYMAGAGKICPRAQLGVGGGRRPTARLARAASPGQAGGLAGTGAGVPRRGVAAARGHEQGCGDSRCHELICF